MELDPNVNPDLHRADCGLDGPCDCDAHRLSLIGKLLRLTWVHAMVAVGRKAT